MTTRRPRRHAARAAGFAYIAAVVFLVVLAGFALAALRLADTAQATASQQVLGARAGHAARAGLEWAFYRLKGPDANCNPVQSVTLGDFVADTGFKVTLTCDVQTYSEGQTPTAAPLKKNVFQLTATACNGTAAACPDDSAAAGADYVERKRSASICIAADGTDCS
ncbi:MSHA biogenesis protein MshP [Massilia sp. TW-1]|uniref:MSHA biogenesis protein MshP n=1 Tax=Telluria antibiotica TaxID=2717319 RepID=A0ABX0PAM1_9BURK|nr:MSHA biogenesis protein MshP [Telluria antibiotica]NIA54367.1 MSHA biogenesis protein MshP [Telluria antibiotica]